MQLASTSAEIVNWTDKGIRTVKDGSKRAANFEKMIKISPISVSWLRHPNFLIEQDCLRFPIDLFAKFSVVKMQEIATTF